MKLLTLIYLFTLMNLSHFLMAEEKVYKTPEIINRIDGDLIYGVSHKNGFLKSLDRGITWLAFNDGLPGRMVYPFDGEGIKMLTSLTSDVKDKERILISSPRELYLTENGAKNWYKIPIKAPIKYSTYITSLSLNPGNKDSIVVGTSFSGIFETENRGSTWKRISDDIPHLYKGAGFYEEISALAISPYDNRSIYYLCAPTNELYISDQERLKWTKKLIPFTDEQITSMRFRATNPNDSLGTPPFVLEIVTDRSIWVFNPVRNWWWQRDLVANQVAEIEGSKRERLKLASDKYGIYISSWHASGELLDNHLQFVLDNNMNSIIVDMKDDFGYLSYNSSLPIIKETGAVKKRIDIESLIKKAYEKGIYVIARIPVFKDSVLYKFQDWKYALKDKNTDLTWGKKFKVENSETGEINWEQREFWVDPFSQFVWEYNVAIAEELQNLGVDEIQFDYIRFPTDGDLSSIKYMHKKSGMLRIEALESFLVMSREKLSIPISTDLYGFNSWYRMGNWNGQSIDMVSNYVDVISPMYYPSHFPGEFLNHLEYLDRAEEIYREGGSRSARIVGDRSLIRPYIQAFLMGHELKMENDEYSKYLNLQIKGNEESETSGFSLWNASNRYYMVNKNFTEYFELNN